MCHLRDTTYGFVGRRDWTHEAVDTPQIDPTLSTPSTHQPCKKQRTLPQALRTGMRLIETKIKLNGLRKSFNLSLHAYLPGRVIVGKYFPTEVESKLYNSPVGSFSWGVWPLDENAYWGAYRLHNPDGSLLRYRFDCLEHSRVLPIKENNHIAELELEFRDLLLDSIVMIETPNKDCSVSFQDEEELRKAIASAQLAPSQILKTEQFRQIFTNKPWSVLQEVDNAILLASDQPISPSARS